MKVETTLKKIMDKEFFPTLKRVMSKWNEARDIHTFVKIAEKINTEMTVYTKTQEAWEKSNGYVCPDGTKSVNPELITDRLLQEYGKFDANSKLSLTGASDQDKEAFMDEKLKADAIMRLFSQEMEKVLEQPFSLEIPRLIKVDPKNIRKEQINANDCFVLLPILDLSAVGDPEPVSGNEDDEEV
jgi:hypothetical protein